MDYFDQQLQAILEALDTTPTELDIRIGNLDPMPTLRKIIYGLNNAGYTTIGSCQGHKSPSKGIVYGPYLLVKGPKQKN